MRDDLRNAIRSLRAAPTFTAVALTVLALGAGLAIGGVVAWYGSASVKTFLFEVQPNDVRVLVGALVTLSAAGLFASVVPARRAASIDPLEALRHQ